MNEPASHMTCMQIILQKVILRDVQAIDIHACIVCQRKGLDNINTIDGSLLVDYRIHALNWSWFHSQGFDRHKCQPK